jgi:hypothetical protein
MGQIGSLGKARREARCGVSGKRRNADDAPIWLTEGRIFTPSDPRYGPLVDGSPRRDPCLASRRENPVKVIPCEDERV